MDALPFIKKILSEPSLIVFLLENVDVNSWFTMEIAIYTYEHMYTGNLREHSEEEKAALIECLRLKARRIGITTRETTSGLTRHRIVTELKKSLDNVIADMVSDNYFQQTEAQGCELQHTNIDAVINSVVHITEFTELFPQTNNSNCLTDEAKGRAFFLMIVFPHLRELTEPYKILEFLLELTIKLDNLPELIFEQCKEQPLEVLLIGSLLSFKPIAYNTWNNVKDSLAKIKKSDNGAPNNCMWHIFTYCYDDLPDSLKACFLYLACYPIDHDIPARSLTEKWIAENFVTKENEETLEDTAKNYLEQLVERSLVWVSKRTFLGTIKYCRVHHSIHKFVIQQSQNDDFLVANPDLEKMKYANRIAIHHDNTKQYTEEEQNRNMHSFLAFDFDKNVYNGCPTNLCVLELRKSAIPEIDLPDMSNLQYLGLRGCILPELPENIGHMKYLQTLDVRDTNIETLPETLWNISALRHVYVDPSPQIKGPHYAAKLSHLQTLKTIVVPQSWVENYPQFLINLRKLALSNTDDQAWKSISKLLSQMKNLLSIEIIGDALPSEVADTRAFPNLETVKSIKLGGNWKCRKLFIDNIKFPENLTKLTLANSDLKEDPMPRLGRLLVLKFLSLQNGAYTGEQMVCSEDGFPQLRVLEISELKNLVLWEVKSKAMSQLQYLEISRLKNLELWKVTPMAMSQLTTLRVVQCWKLKNLHDLEHVSTIEVIEN